MGTARRVIILGSTGSIGKSALDVVRHTAELHRRGLLERPLKVVGLAARGSEAALRAQAEEFGVGATALAEGGAEAATFTGPDAARRLVAETEADVVLAAVVGVAGLPAALEAARLGRDIALANKETLVAGGALMVEACRASGARLLPVDSEHSALWQCLEAAAPGCAPPFAAAGRDGATSGAAIPRAVRRLTLTASGGPFREWPKARIEAGIASEALNHPTWSMGPKVTIDSAGLVNKALEVIEAHWLFGVAHEAIDVLIHPQSVVHGLIELSDGAMLAHLAGPDMRHPIQHALLWPERAPGADSLRRVDLSTLRALHFEAPDLDRFPGLGFARRVLAQGGTAGAVFNAANEVAVERFLAGEIRFGQIARIIERTLDQAGEAPTPDCLEAVLRADQVGRMYAARVAAERDTH